MNQVVRFARRLAIKYGLESRAAMVPVNEDRIIAEVKRDVLDAYRNYFSRSARDSMFQYAADLKEKQSIQLVYQMDLLVKDLDRLQSPELMAALKHILKLMHHMKADPTRSVRNAIYDSVSGNSEGQRNKRQRLLTKYERSLYMAFPALQKAAIKLRTVVPDETFRERKILRQPGELSKQQLINFVLSNPTFRIYGVDSLEIMEQLLSDPEMKGHLTTLIESVNRGHTPLDGSRVQNFARQVKKRLEQRQQNNLPYLDVPESPPEKE